MTIKNIEDLNTEEAKQYIGGVVLVTILMVIGIIGNFHVVFVYAFKMKASNHRIFILTLAILDLITCSIGMPFIIVDLRNPLTFTMVSACKVLRFINYFICGSSVLVLLVIAVERYKKICVPLGKQISQKNAKLYCIVVLGITLLFSWPAPVLYGGSTVEIENQNITGTRCYTEDKFKDTKYQAYFNAVLILVFIGVFTVLVVLYSLIGRVIIKHSTYNARNKGKTTLEFTGSAVTSDTKETLVTSNNSLQLKNSVQLPSVSFGNSSGSDLESTSVPADKKHITKFEKGISQKSTEQDKYNKMRKTTYMLFIITVVFFCSYFPHLILKIVTFIKKDFVENMSFTGKVFYNTFIWCFFINNMANSIIYGFCDARFRQEVFAIYRNLLNRMRTI